MASLRAFIISRVLLTIPMIFILLTIVFYVLRMMPGDPVTAMLGEKASPKLVEEMRIKLGLNKPLLYQYIDYVTNVLRGDFGLSTWTRRPVLDEILDRFPATLELAIAATIVSIGIGIICGALAAYREKTVVDLAFRLFGIISYSLFIPWFGMVLQMIFSVHWHLLPTSGRIYPLLKPRRITGLYVLDSLLTWNLKALSNAISHLILPSITLGIVLSGIYIRLTRNSMIEILRQDFITAARARGVSENTVLVRHALKNTLIPLLTMMGLQFALLLGGAVLTETTFSWPGMGTFLLERIYYRDFPAIQGTIIFYGILVALVSLIVDVLYAYIDPRIRY